MTTPESPIDQSAQSSMELDESGQTLFEAILHPNSAIETVVSDWVEAYTTSADAALPVIINFIIRSCGCNRSVSADVHVDDDEIVKTLEELQEAFDKETMSDYPLVSKSRDFKKFRKSLLEFFHRLIKQVKHSILYDDVFCERLQAWIMAMSRHTATTIALALMTVLCETAQEIQSEFNIARRQLITEQNKNKGARNTRNKDRISSLQAQTKELEDKKNQLDNFLGAFFDGYRDVEAVIRAECIREMGLWITKYPDRFLDDIYLRYLGWQLSDKSPSTRTEAIKSLSRVYANETFIRNLRHFTERFKSRLLEMALRESDINVRIPSIQLLTQISKAGLFEDEDRAKFALLIYSDNSKVRKAVATFIMSTLQEDYIDIGLERVRNAANEGSTRRKKASASAKNIKEDWVKFKCFAEFLVKCGAEIKNERLSVEEDRMEDENEPETNANHEDAAITQRIGGGKKSRIGLAVHDLWSELSLLHDWKSLAEYLSKDHSLRSGGRLSRQSGNETAPSDPIEEGYRLSEEEETVLVEVLVACLKLLVTEVTNVKDKKDAETQLEQTRGEISRTMAKLLPRLLTKYAPDAGRIAEVLQIPSIMGVEVYMDLRMNKAFSSLVDDIKKLFLKHTHPLVLAHAAEAIRHIMQYENFASLIETTLSELQEEVVRNFREECETNSLADGHLSNDQVHAIGAALYRLEQLISVINVVESIEEGEDDKDVLTLVVTLAKRGLLSIPEEEKLVLSSINFLWHYILWKVNNVFPSETESEDIDISTEIAENLMKKRDNIIEALSELVLDEAVSSNIRRNAFINTCNIYWLFSSDIFYSSDNNNVTRLRLTCPSQVQRLFAQYVEKELERLRGLVDAAIIHASEEIANDMDEEEEDQVVEKRTKTTKKDLDAIISLDLKYSIMETAGSLLRATRIGVFNADYTATVVCQYGRFGNDVDELIRKVVQEFKERAIEEGSSILCRVCIDSMQKSFELYIDDKASSMESTNLLARVFTHALQLRDIYDSTPRRDSEHITYMHLQAIQFITSKMVEFNNAEDRKATKVIKYFKPLTLLLGGIKSADATRINSKLQEEFQNKGLSIPENERDWEPYYSYTQKLHKIMGKVTETSRILMDIEIRNARKRRRPVREERHDLEELVDAQTPNKQSKTK
ncbi:761_t:CDS:10 [Paraglomus occultum]|uniref:761_t:CDS:1 n=1 Tax=Paraglomus occultum TaxID=144539 RepID=A0A9N9G2Q1_9GLOM|nr:761_t:CDS:10 [Paraglomus occultum]